MRCDSCGWNGVNVVEIDFCPNCGDDTKLRVILD